MACQRLPWEERFHPLGAFVVLFWALLVDAAIGARPSPRRGDFFVGDKLRAVLPICRQSALNANEKWFGRICGTFAACNMNAASLQCNRNALCLPSNLSSPVYGKPNLSLGEERTDGDSN